MMPRQHVMRMPALTRVEKQTTTVTIQLQRPSGTRRQREDLELGDVLAGRYRLLACIASGGMGDVYRAKDLLLEREVAVKIMTPHCMAESNAIARCQREAQAMAALDSPFLPPIYDLGYEADYVFLVMRYISASPLSAIIAEQGRLPSLRVARIACNVLDALQHMHANNFVHRDVKPSNILVDAYDHATLVDLGIVLDSAASPLTTKGYVLGTPAYMSPEQRHGHSIDGRSDLYSVGVTLIAALTGRVARRSVAERDIRHHLQHVPGPWHGVIERALHEDVKQRFPSAESMKLAIGQALSGSAEKRMSKQLGRVLRSIKQSGRKWHAPAIKTTMGLH